MVGLAVVGIIASNKMRFKLLFVVNSEPCGRGDGVGFKARYGSVGAWLAGVSWDFKVGKAASLMALKNMVEFLKNSFLTLRDENAF